MAARNFTLVVLLFIASACQQNGLDRSKTPSTADDVLQQAASTPSTLLLEQENSAPVHNPTWQQVLSALMAIDVGTRSFSILSGPNGYVQTAGSAAQLTVEYRMIGPDSFSHYRLGREPLTQRLASVSYSGGEIRVRESEILTLEDCILVFRSFFEQGKMPDGYHLRLLDDTYK